MAGYVNCWKVLKIKKTSDIREIKKAYARQLKLHNPEDDPEGFMKLREAYESALNIANYSAKSSDGYEETARIPVAQTRAQTRARTQAQTAEIVEATEAKELPCDDQTGSPEVSPPEAGPQEAGPQGATPPETGSPKVRPPETGPQEAGFAESPHEPAAKMQSVGTMLGELYSDFNRRMDPEQWRRLLGSLSISELQMLERIIITFLNENYILPGYIWAYLDAEFNIGRNQFFRWHLLMDESQDICEWVLTIPEDQISTGFDIAKYAELRINAYIAYTEDNLETAKSFAGQAVDMFKNDYLMYRILGYCLLKTGDAIDAASAYEKSLSLRYDDDVEYNVALARMQSGEYKLAAAGFRRILDRRYKRKDRIRLRGRLIKCEESYIECRYRIGKMTKTGYSFRKNTVAQMKNSWRMSPRGYRRFVIIFVVAMIVLIGIPYLLALINGQL